MRDQDKTKEQLIIELEGIRKRITKLERSMAECTKREKVLQYSKERLQVLMESAPVIICTSDLKSRVRFVNKKFEEITGYSRGEIIGKSWVTLGVLSPENTKLLLRRMVEKLHGSPPRPMEIQLKRKDGGLIWVSGIGEVIKEHGKPVELQIIASDITERKRAAEGMERAAKEWRSTFDAISDMVSIHDDNFKIVRVNKSFARAFGMEPQTVIGKVCYELVHGTEKPWSDCPHKLALNTMNPCRKEFFNPHMGIHLEIICSPMLNEKGKAIATVHIMRDITERKRMQEKLIVTDRLASIGELSSGIAHELNNPLTAIIGFSDLLMRKDLPADIKDDLKVISKEAKRATGVVKGLLTFARKHPEERQSVDVNKVIQEVLALRAYEQKVNNIEVSTQFAPDLPEITANGFELQQVFINIIINAEHFITEAHGRGALTITTERLGDVIRASFADDGPGIAEATMGHLFDPFFTTKEVGKGTGLGLSISHGIITSHGGRIYAESELGKGATFVVELPVSK